MKKFFFIIVSFLFVLVNFGFSQKHVIQDNNDSNVVALWHFDEGSGNVLHDASGNNNNGIIYNASWVLGKEGNALHFNGQNSYVMLPNSNTLKQQREFTVELWLSLDSIGYIRGYEDLPAILGNIGHYIQGGGWVLYLQNSNQMKFNYRSPNSGSNFNHAVNISLAHHYYFIAVTFKRDSTRTIIKTYLDGVLSDSTSFPYPIQYDDTPNFYIGTNIDGRAVGGNGIREFMGTLDEVRISKVALQPSQFEINTLTASTSYMNFGFLNVGRDSTRILTLNNQSVSETLTIDSIASTNSKFAVTGTTGPVVPGGNTTFTVTYTPTAAGADDGTIRFYSSGGVITETDVHVFGRAYTGSIDTNIVADWHFDEGSGNIAYDASVYGNDGTINGNIQWVNGKKGKALHFDGYSSYVQVPNTESLKPQGNFTIEAWINLDTLKFGNNYCYYCYNRDAVILSDYSPTSSYGYGGFQFSVTENLGLRFEFMREHNGWGIGTATRYSPIMNQHLFYHVAEVYNNLNDSLTILKTYINGTLMDSSTASYAISYTETPYLYIGTNSNGYATGGYGNEEFPGIIDEVRITKVAKDPSQFGLSGITVSENAVKMGEVRFGRSVSKQVTISNLSFTDSVTVQGQSLTNTPPLVYMLDSCSVLFTLPPRGSHTATITFTPADSGSYNGGFAFTPTDSTLGLATVSVIGTAFKLLDVPQLLSVLDIPNDQGKQVRLIWRPSKYDAQGESLKVNEYSVWRLVDDVDYYYYYWIPKTAMKDHRNGSVFSVNDKKLVVLDDQLWDFVSTVPAVQFDKYAMVAPTLYNTTYWWQHNTTFRIAAHAVTGEFFFSQPDSGYSTDDIYPTAPAMVAITGTDHEISVSWSAAPDQDVFEYYVYRGIQSNFTLTSSNKIGTTHSTEFYDNGAQVGTRYYYAVTSVDSSGNESRTAKYSVVTQITDVRGDHSVIPADYYLSQNYPNPFNPSTTLKYGLPEQSRVWVAVYNTLGQQVAELVNEEQQAGTYEALWQANVSSGIYFYRIDAASLSNPNRTFNKVGKMLLVK